MGWALTELRAEQALELIERGQEVYDNQLCTLIDVVHLGRNEVSNDAVQSADTAAQHVYRLWINENNRLVRLDYRGFTYIYGNYITVLSLGRTPIPTSIRCYSQGILQWDHTINPFSFQVMSDPGVPIPHKRSPSASTKVHAVEDDDYSTDKIWNENRPDTMGGDAPFGTYHGDTVASVNVQNLNLNVTIPLVNYPQRGAVGLPIGVSYDSKLWDVDYAGSDAPWGSSKAKIPPGGKIDFYRHLYSRGSVNGWRNLSGLYTLEVKREHYDQFGRGKPEYYRGYLWEGEVPKVLAKMYLYMPDGGVHELMDIDPDPLQGDQGEKLHDPYEPGYLWEVTSKLWESTDGSQIRVKLGDRGNSYDVAVHSEGSEDYLIIADGLPGVRILRLTPTEPHYETISRIDTPWAACRVQVVSDSLGNDFLYVGTNHAGLRIYNITNLQYPTEVAKAFLDDGDVSEMKYDSAAHRLWILHSSRGAFLSAVDVTNPGNPVLSAQATLYSSEYYSEKSSSALEIWDNYAYVARTRCIDVFQMGKAGLELVDHFNPSTSVNPVYKALLRNGTEMYALVSSSRATSGWPGYG